MQWHALTTEETLASLSTDLEQGLTSSEVQERLAEHGPNVITPQKGPGPLRRALAQFNQALVIILVIAGAVTAALGEWVDSGVIFGVVLINAIIGYLQETKAVKAIQALSRSMTAETTVVRNGQRIRLSATEVVPGDIIVLQAGDKIPADMRLTYSRDLRIDESALTGESLPVDKLVAALPESTALADRANMAYASTLATSGQGTGIVATTGDVPRSDAYRVSSPARTISRPRSPARSLSSARCSCSSSWVWQRSRPSWESCAENRRWTCFLPRSRWRWALSRRACRRRSPSHWRSECHG